MGNVIDLVYKQEKNEISIKYLDKTMDVSRIQDFTLEQWLFPFLSQGIKWKGLYEELVDFTGETELTLRFIGDEKSFSLVKYALAKNPVKLVGSNNTVNIVYTENPFTTKIIVNGSIYDTSMIQNRCIDEWVKPIHIRDFQWNGIFKELENYIGTDTYTIYFVGDPSFMSVLYDDCPETVNIFYKDTKMLSQPKAPKSTEGVGAKIMEKIDKENITAAAKKVVENIKDVNPEADNDKLPIKNPFIRQHLTTILMGLSIVTLFLPFLSFGASVEAGGMSAGAKMTFTGFETIFGIKDIRVGDNSSIFAFLFLIVPIIVICSNYIKALAPAKCWIVRGVPLLGIVAQVIVIADLKGIFKTMAAMAEVKLKVGLGLGFILLFVIYFLTAAVGFIVYGKDDLKNFSKR